MIGAYKLVESGCGLSARKNASSTVAQVADNGFPALKEVITIPRRAPLRDGYIL